MVDSGTGVCDADVWFVRVITGRVEGGISGVGWVVGGVGGW